MSDKQSDKQEGLIYEAIADIRAIKGIGVKPMLSELADVIADKIDGLEADLDNAVETAFKRGARKWCKDNYPDKYVRFVENEKSQ